MREVGEQEFVKQKSEWKPYDSFYLFDASKIYAQYILKEKSLTFGYANLQKYFFNIQWH